MTTPRCSTAPAIPLRPSDVQEWWVRMEDTCLSCLIGSTCWFRFSSEDQPFFGRVEDVGGRLDGTFAVALAFGGTHDLEGSSLVRVMKRRRIEGFTRRLHDRNGRLSLVPPIRLDDVPPSVRFGTRSGASPDSLIEEWWQTR